MAPDAREMRWDDDVDVAVFGSGAGGMAAALVAASAGLHVALYEKTALVGGTTANSGGGVWMPANVLARQAGIDDSIGKARRYLKHELGPHFRADLVDAYLGTIDEALDYYATRSEVRFQLSNIPDYHAEHDGGVAAGRTLFPLPFDGRRLGPDFALLRPPWKRFTVLGGMMIGRREIPALLAPFSSFATFRTVAAMVGRHALDRLRYPRGTNLLLGNALAARLLYSLRRQNVAIRVEAALASLVCKNDEVIGAIVRTPSGTLRVKARRGVVLATGGFPHGATWRDTLASSFPFTHSPACEANSGDALEAATRAGAVVDRDLASPAFWTPASLVAELDGGMTVFPYGHLDRGKPGAIIVNARGCRFVNEADSYHDVVLAMYAGPDREANLRSHLVRDAHFLRTYGLGAVRPRWPVLKRFVRDGYLVEAGTIAGLARAIGVDPATLERTIAEHNRDAAAGEDAFGKGDSIFNRYNGDPACKPNPCLRPIARPPYYALRLHPAALGTSVGLRTDGDARALREDGSPVGGLYACGNDMASVMRGYYPAAGITLGPALVFGYRAGRHLAQVRAAAPRPAAMVSAG